MPVDPDLRRRLTVRRMALGISQRELASIAGLAKCQISDLERGKTDPRLSTVRRWTAALDMRLTLGVELAEGETAA